MHKVQFKVLARAVLKLTLWNCNFFIFHNVPLIAAAIEIAIAVTNTIAKLIIAVGPTTITLTNVITTYLSPHDLDFLYRCCHPLFFPLRCWTCIIMTIRYLLALRQRCFAGAPKRVIEVFVGFAPTMLRGLGVYFSPKRKKSNLFLCAFAPLRLCAFAPLRLCAFAPLLSCE